MAVLHEFDRLWKPPPSATDAAIRPLPPPTPEMVNELVGSVQSEAESGAIPGDKIRSLKSPLRSPSTSPAHNRRSYRRCTPGGRDVYNDDRGSTDAGRRSRRSDVRPRRRDASDRGENEGSTSPRRRRPAAAPWSPLRRTPAVGRDWAFFFFFAFQLLPEHRPPTILRHSARSCALLSASLQLSYMFPSSFSTVLFHVFFGLPLSRQP